MRRIAAVFLVATTALLVGCSSVSLTPRAGSGSHTCADRVAQALSSPTVPVPGAFACMSTSMQEGARSAGVANDADFEKVAGTDPAYTSYRLLGVTAAGALVYELDGSTACQVMEITVDSSGKVATIDGLHPDQIK